VKLLLDTHVLLWALGSPRRISPEVQRLIANSRNRIFVSVVSLFEVAMRGPAARRLSLDVDAEKVRSRSVEAGYEILPVTADHAIAAESIAPFHKDPFDRLILAQAQTEDLRLITHDERLAAYDTRAVLF
jgi:PIN domain nuclease of toxin-antitoxin system